MALRADAAADAVEEAAGGCWSWGSRDAVALRDGAAAAALEEAIA